MKRKHADRYDWKRILSKQFALTQVDSSDFTGYISLIKINSVRQPLVVTMDGKRLKLVDVGYCWMQYFPSDEHYSITTVFNERGQVVQWYVDICEPFALDERGIPYFVDLYLDVVLLPTGHVFLLDEDELEEALEWGRISHDQYRIAVNEASRLFHEVKEHSLIGRSKDDYIMMLQLLEK